MRHEFHPRPSLPPGRFFHGLSLLLPVAILAGLLHACGGESPAGPGGTNGVTSVSVTVGLPGQSTLTTGGTITVSAWETLTDGESRNCTSGATWRSSNPAVAVITAPGTLAGLTAGTTVLTATCSGVTGAATVTVAEGAVLVGTVSDEAGAPLSGALVYVMSGKYGATGTSDASGRYRVANLIRGTTYPVSARKDGYETTSMTVNVDAAEVRMDFTLRLGFSVGGRVTEAGIGPLEGAIVEVVSGVNAGKKSLPTTSWSGGYTIGHLLPGRFTLRASKAGYEPSERELEASVSTTVDFTLRAAYGNCLLSVAPLTIERVPAAGAEATIAVDTPPGRAWSAAPDHSWIELLTGPNAVGPGLVRLRIQPAQPGATDVRQAILRVGCSANEGQNIPVSQLPDCKTSVSWAPGSPTTFTAAGGQGTVLVRTGVPGCHWSAASRSDWIRTVGVNDWYGDLEAHFVVEPNTTGADRVGALVFGEVVWEVRQGG